MADQKCSECGELFQQGDLLKALVVARFVALKSKIHYALTKPTECQHVEHLYCDDPQGTFHESD